MIYSSQDAAGIILLDDNFSSIVAGVYQGRLSSDNLRKSIMYTLCSKVPQFLPTIGGVVGLPTALTITQILAIDIGTDIWTSIAYALQPAESDLMKKKPRWDYINVLWSGQLLLTLGPGRLWWLFNGDLWQFVGGMKISLKFDFSPALFLDGGEFGGPDMRCVAWVAVMVLWRGGCRSVFLNLEA